MFTLVRVVSAVIVACSVAQSSPQLYGQSPDIEAMKRSLEAQISVFQRLNDLERRVGSLESKGGDRSSSAHDASASGTEARKPTGPAVAPPTETAAGPSSTTVCRCQGYKEHLCLCLKAGVRCHCSRTVGSVWAVNDKGRATHKTGAKADPRKAVDNSRQKQPVTAPKSNGGTENSVSTGFVVTKRSDGRWWWNDGTRWHYTSLRPVDGTTYRGGHGAFEYRAGRMHALGAKMMAVIHPASTGHWETRRVCRGSYCENVRVWVAE